MEKSKTQRPEAVHKKITSRYFREKTENLRATCVVLLGATSLGTIDRAASGRLYFDPAIRNDLLTSDLLVEILEHMDEVKESVAKS